MEEKKTTKISLSTFFLIVSIIVIFVMSLLLYQNNKEKNNWKEEVNELNNRVNTIENNKQASKTENKTKENKGENSNKKSYSYSDVKGLYEFEKKIDDEFSAFYTLYLYENGTYKYQYGVEVPEGTIGNYIIEENKIIMNALFATGSDVGAHATSGNITLNINEDGTLSDKNGVIKVQDTNISNTLNNIKLQKTSQEKEKKYLEDIPSINKFLDRTYLYNKFAEEQN